MLRHSHDGIACLTFDDGPDPFWTPRILDALAEAGARATFFVLTPLATEHPRLIDRMLREGHEIALHCREHTRHTGMTETEIHADTRRGLEDLASLDVEPVCWRPPWGIATDGTRRVADEFGLRLALWTSDTHDWRGDGSGEMLRGIAEGLSDGSVVLMHDGLGPGATRYGCGETLDLVPAIVETLDLKGLRTTTIEELNRANGTGRERRGARSSTA